MGSTTQKRASDGLGFGTIVIIVLGAVIVLILAFLKIYLSNHIYYESKKLSKVKREVIALRAQNKRLKAKVEALRFKQNILDTIVVEQEVSRAMRESE